MPFTFPNSAAATYVAQAEIFQTDIDVLLAGFIGTGVQSGCAVTTSGAADNKVNVAVGDVMVAYVRASVTAATVTLTAPDATNPRIDIVWVDSTGALGKTNGTAAAAPAPPALPASTVAVAFVYSPASGGNTVGSLWITDKRVNVDNGGLSIFGDGSDGNVTISAGTTTLTRDMFYDTLTVQTGATLATANFRVFCRTKCQVDANGVIANNGPNAVGTVGGVGAVAGSLTKGGDGGTGAASGGTGTAGGNVAASLGGPGGDGGAGNGTVGGTGGTASVAATNGSVRGSSAALGEFLGNGTTVRSIAGGGGGGGGGGGTGGGAGGGGGAAGGPILICARLLVLNGQIRANGGNGANGTATNGGGGGGGGGGHIHLVYASKQGTGTTSVALGTHGTANGTGVNGNDGTIGTVVEIVH